MDRLPKRQMSRRHLLKTFSAASAASVAAPLVAKLHAALAPTRSATPTSAGDLAALFAELDAFVANRMAELKVPGVAIGVIAGDQEHAQGFGVTNVDHPLPVDTDTLFQIGSTTKTFRHRDHAPGRARPARSGGAGAVLPAGLPRRRRRGFRSKCGCGTW